MRDEQETIESILRAAGQPVRRPGDPIEVYQRPPEDPAFEDPAPYGSARSFLQGLVMLAMTAAGTAFFGGLSYQARLGGRTGETAVLGLLLTPVALMLLGLAVPSSFDVGRGFFAQVRRPGWRWPNAWPGPGTHLTPKGWAYTISPMLCLLAGSVVPLFFGPPGLFHASAVSHELGLIAAGVSAGIMCLGTILIAPGGRYGVALVIVAGAYGALAQSWVNMHYDGSEGRAFTATVLAWTYVPEHGAGRGHHAAEYRLTLGPWGPIAKQTDFGFPVTTAHAPAAGSGLCMVLHTGFLGSPWYDQPNLDGC